MPKSRTTKISNDTIQINHRLGFTIIKPIESFKVVPIFCELCEICMNGELDRQYYEKYSCCFSCGSLWADGNQDAWLSGWRPEANKIKEEKNRRATDSISFSL